MLALISSAKRKSLERKSSIQWESVLPDLQDTLQQARERWREAFEPLVSGVVTDAADHWKTEAGIAFDVTRLEDQLYFTEFMAKFSDPITATSEREIAAMLQFGQKEGWSVSQMQNGLTQMFQQWISGDVTPDDWGFAGVRLPPWRTELIARTETVKSAGFGTLTTFKESGVVNQKEWLSTQDDRTRESHLEADGQVVGIDDPFSVGGVDMQYPGDPSAPVEEIANCRCVLLPIVSE